MQNLSDFLHQLPPAAGDGKSLPLRHVFVLHALSRFNDCDYQQYRRWCLEAPNCKVVRSVGTRWGFHPYACLHRHWWALSSRNAWMKVADDHDSRSCYDGWLHKRFHLRRCPGFLLGWIQRHELHSQCLHGGHIIAQAQSPCLRFLDHSLHWHNLCRSGTGAEILPGVDLAVGSWSVDHYPPSSLYSFPGHCFQQPKQG